MRFLPLSYIDSSAANCQPHFCNPVNVCVCYKSSSSHVLLSCPLQPNQGSIQVTLHSVLAKQCTALKRNLVECLDGSLCGVWMACCQSRH